MLINLDYHTITLTTIGLLQFDKGSYYELDYNWTTLP